MAAASSSENPSSATSRKACGVLLGKSFQRDQQEGLPRQRRDMAESPLDRHLDLGRRLGGAVDGDGIPDLGEQPIERHARRA